MFVTPFLIGLASSLHCIGMCSPLVIAASKVGKHAVLRNASYNLGRIMTYGILGSTVSFLGTGLNMIGIQQGFSLVVGAVILLIAIAKINVALPTFVNRFLSRLISFGKSKVHLNPFFLGMFNGLLPCGMTLVALAYCVTLEWPTEGFLAMIYFGLGTLPAMLGFSSITRVLIQKLPIGYRHIQTILLIASGIILIGRGIDLHTLHDANDHEIVVCGSAAGR